MPGSKKTGDPKGGPHRCHQALQATVRAPFWIPSFFDLDEAVTQPATQPHRGAAFRAKSKPATCPPPHIREGRLENYWTNGPRGVALLLLFLVDVQHAKKSSIFETV